MNEAVFIEIVGCLLRYQETQSSSEIKFPMLTARASQCFHSLTRVRFEIKWDERTAEMRIEVISFALEATVSFVAMLNLRL
jgi:hypothetical protein